MMTPERLKEVLDYDPITGVFTWRIKKANASPAGKVAGTIAQDGYRHIGVDGSIYKAHRLAWMYMTGAFPEFDTDHINGDRLDNRLANLRAASREINQQNQRRAHKQSQTGSLGVGVKDGRFRARIVVKGKEHSLGRHPTKEAAEQAYLRAKRELHQGNTL